MQIDDIIKGLKNIRNNLKISSFFEQNSKKNLLNRISYIEDKNKIKYFHLKPIFSKYISICLMIILLFSLTINIKPSIAYIGLLNGEIDSTFVINGQEIYNPQNYKIRLGDEIRTLEGASGNLEFIDGSTILISEDTQLKIENLLIDQQDQKNSIIGLKVDYGNVQANVVPKLKSNIEIETPTDIIKASGNELSISVDKKQGNTKITEITTSNKPIEVSKKENIDIEKEKNLILDLDENQTDTIEEETVEDEKITLTINQTEDIYNILGFIEIHLNNSIIALQEQNTKNLDIQINKIVEKIDRLNNQFKLNLHVITINNKEILLSLYTLNNIKQYIIDEDHKIINKIDNILSVSQAVYNALEEKENLDIETIDENLQEKIVEEHIELDSGFIYNCHELSNIILLRNSTQEDDKNLNQTIYNKLDHISQTIIEKQTINDELGNIYLRYFLNRYEHLLEEEEKNYLLQNL